MKKMQARKQFDQWNLFCCETQKSETVHTTCNLIFMTVGDANINTCVSSVTLHRTEFSLKARKSVK